MDCKYRITHLGGQADIYKAIFILIISNTIEVFKQHIAGDCNCLEYGRGEERTQDPMFIILVSRPVGMTGVDTRRENYY